MSKISISRNSGFADIFGAYQVMLDGKQIGKINDGGTETYEVAPGKHELRLKIDWCGSNTVVFDLDKNDLAFECGSPKPIACFRRAPPPPAAATRCSSAAPG